MDSSALTFGPGLAHLSWNVAVKPCGGTVAFVLRLGRAGEEEMRHGVAMRTCG